MIFGILLILAGFTILSLPEKPFDPSCNPIILGVKKIFPSLPLFMAISSESRSIEKNLGDLTLCQTRFFIEFSDIIFPIDLAPAIFELINEPFVVFISNIFAIIGLFSLLFVLRSMVKAFLFLKYGLDGTLVFVNL